MMPTMKSVIAAIGLVCALTIGQSQNTASGQVNPPAASAKTKSKSKFVPPKELDAPPPDPTFDEGKRPVILTVTIGIDGLVHDATIVQSSDSTRADANALKAVKSWRYKPATQDGVPIAVQINIELHPMH
jgi:TonB family protein